MAYRGSKSRNSILGNKIRKSLSSKAMSALNKLNKTLTPEQAQKLVNSKSDGDVNWKGSPNLKLGGYAPYINSKSTFKEHLDKLGKGTPDLSGGMIYTGSKSTTKPVLLHELGHYKASKKKDSHNQKAHMLDAIDIINEGKKIKTPEDKEARRFNTIKSEREAWVEARKLNEKKESPVDKAIRKSALNTYERKLEEQAQSERFRSDRKYRNKMLSRTGIKAGGALGGALLGSELAKRLNKNEIKEINELSKRKALSSKDKKRLSYLKSKVRAKKFILAGGGALGGYKLSKHATRNMIK